MRFEDSLLIAEPHEVELLQMVLVILDKPLMALRLVDDFLHPLDIAFLLELQSYLPELRA